MSSRREIGLIAGTSAAALAVGGMLLAGPSYREAASFAEQLDSLQEKVCLLEERTERVRDLSDQVARARREVAALQRIPQQPEVADLVRRLSMPVDGIVVRDQTFAASSPASATPDPAFPLRSMPITVEMKGNFAALFEMLRVAESMDRLVRINSVRLSRQNADSANENEQTLAASVGLDAIYRPAEAQP